MVMDYLQWTRTKQKKCMSHNLNTAAEKLKIILLLGKYGIRVWFCCLKKQHYGLKRSF